MSVRTTLKCRKSNSLGMVVTLQNLLCQKKILLHLTRDVNKASSIKAEAIKPRNRPEIMQGQGVVPGQRQLCNQRFA